MSVSTTSPNAPRERAPRWKGVLTLVVFTPQSVFSIVDGAGAGVSMK